MVVVIHSLSFVCTENSETVGKSGLCDAEAMMIGNSRQEEAQQEDKTRNALYDPLLDSRSPPHRTGARAGYARMALG